MIERATPRKALTFLLATGLSLAAYNGLERDTLDREESAAINKQARLGRFGLEGYRTAIETKVVESERFGEITQTGLSNIGDFSNKTVPLGESLITTNYLDGGYVPELGENASAYDESAWTIDAAEQRGAYITYKNTSGNMGYDSEESAVFLNPDANFFGSDRAASPAEVAAFFRDSHTEPVELSYQSDDVINGETDYTHTSENGEVELNLSVDNAYRDDIDIDGDSPNAVQIVTQELFF